MKVGTRIRVRGFDLKAEDGIRDDDVTGVQTCALPISLTDDTKTIAAMIPALSPSIVPAPGSQLSPALELAFELFQNSGVASGRILIITDEIRDVVAAQRIARRFRNAYPVSVMSVGTTEGAPVALVSGRPEAGYLKDSSGNLVIPGLNVESLRDFAELARSEERRVGKECRSRWSPYH